MDSIWNLWNYVEYVESTWNLWGSVKYTKITKNHAKIAKKELKFYSKMVTKECM